MLSVWFALTGASVGNKRRNIPHSGNARLHWAARANWNRVWKQQAGLAALCNRNGYGPFARANVTITLHACHLLDADNAHACIKPIVDGLKGILIADDSREHIVLKVKQTRVPRRADEHVEVEVSAV